MFIQRVLDEYKKAFGFRASLKRSSKINKLIFLYLFIYVVDAGLLLYFFYTKNNVGMLICLAIYILLFIVANKQSKYKLNETIKSNPYRILGTKEFNVVMKRLYITTNEELLILSKLIDKEIELIKIRSKFPLGDILRQLSIALLITGLLTNAFFEIRVGNIKGGTSFLTLYIAFIGVVLISNGIIKIYQDFFGKLTYLMEISSYIHLSELSQSIENKMSESKNSSLEWASRSYK
ncbi:hypothetical protein [Bacillus coahuilensis]|uniref:hypothetical protein n=1 Tax=Bacillus coahuilensis TaxID=408580 RepID=UPI0001850A12|nr:hypothetical protein [Bacillus coahuilensis]